MSRSFSDFGEFAAFLRGRIPAAHEAEQHGLGVAGKDLADKAQDLIGHEHEMWPDLAASTVEAKRAKGQTGRISDTDPLYARGEYLHSFSHHVSPGSVVFGTDDPIAPLLERGTAKMPPRPVVGPTLFRHGHEAVEIVANRIMGSVAGKPGGLKSDHHSDKPDE